MQVEPVLICLRRYNVMQITRKKLKISADMLNQKTWIGRQVMVLPARAIRSEGIHARHRGNSCVWEGCSSSGEQPTTLVMMEYAEGSAFKLLSLRPSVCKSRSLQFLEQIYTQNASNDWSCVRWAILVWWCQHALLSLRQVHIGEKPAELCRSGLPELPSWWKTFALRLLWNVLWQCRSSSSTATSTAKDFRNSDCSWLRTTTQASAHSVRYKRVRQAIVRWCRKWSQVWHLLSSGSNPSMDLRCKARGVHA